MTDLDRYAELYKYRDNLTDDESLEITLLKAKIEGKIDRHDYIDNVFIDLEITPPYDLWLVGAKEMESQVAKLKNYLEADEMVMKTLNEQVAKLKEELELHESKPIGLLSDELSKKLERENTKLKEELDEREQECNIEKTELNQQVAKLKEELEIMTESTDFWCDKSLTQQSTLDEIKYEMTTGVFDERSFNKLKTILAKHEGKE